MNAHLLTISDCIAGGRRTTVAAVKACLAIKTIFFRLAEQPIVARAAQHAISAGPAADTAKLVPDWGRRFGALAYSGLLAAVVFMNLALPRAKNDRFSLPMLESKSWLTMGVM